MAYIDNVTNILQIQPDGLPTFVRLSQNENGRNLYFQLAGNEIDIPANATITISGTKPDGTVYSGTGSISDNVILIPEMIQMTAVAGYWDAKVKIISGGNTIATGRIRFVIDADTVDPDSVPSDSELEGLVAEAQQYAETARTEAYGSPLTATTAAGMTDHTRVYVYTGSESRYTAGHWYFWNGSAWTDGGIYNSTAVNTDTTLTLAGVAADAKATGDAIEAARVAIDDTLTNEGEAADAAAVGSEISGLKEDLNELNTDAAYRISVEWESGIIDGSTGAESDNANYSRTVDYIPTTDADYVSAGGGGFTLILFDLENESYVRKASKYVNAASSPWAIDKRYGYFRISGGIKIANHPENAYLIYKYTKTKSELDAFKAYYAGVYVADLYSAEGKEVSWTQTASNITLDLSKTNGFSFVNFVPAYDIPKSVILSAAQLSQYTTVDGDTISGNNFCIIYDVDTKTVSVTNGASARLAPNKRNLFSVYFASSISGDIVDAEMRRRWENTISRIKSLESAIDSGSTLPDYWITYMQTKIRDVQSKDLIVENHGDAFVWCTDQHFPTNDGNSPGAIKYILDHSSVVDVVMGGDLINGSNISKQTAVNALVDARNHYIAFKPKYLRGNHDTNVEISGASPELAISDSELYGVLLKPIENDVVADGQLYYYYDNDAQKIRYICLDTGAPDTNVISDAQITWMQERITELTSGWTAVIFTHQYYSTVGTMDGNGTKILAGLNAIYDNSVATIACVICGHSHADYAETTSKGFPIIATTCDVRGGQSSAVPLERTRGTITEQAFDVFHIDTLNRDIYTTRIGAGTDRTFSY